MTSKYRRKWFAESPDGSLASADCEQDAEFMAAQERSGWAREFILFTEPELSALLRAEREVAFMSARQEYIHRPGTLQEIKDWRYVTFEDYEKQKEKP